MFADTLLFGQVFGERLLAGTAIVSLHCQVRWERHRRSLVELALVFAIGAAVFAAIGLIFQAAGIDGPPPVQR